MYEGQQGLPYLMGLTATTAGTSGICLHIAVIPPGRRAKTHLHHAIETVVYVIAGAVDCHWGPQLGEVVTISADSFMYIPAEMPHLVINRHPTAACRAVIAHSAPDDQVGIVLLPELDALIPG